MSSASEGRFLSSSVPLLTRVPRFATLLTDDGVTVEAVYEPCTAGFGASAGARAEPAADTPVIVVARVSATGWVNRPAPRVLAGSTGVLPACGRDHVLVPGPRAVRRALHGGRPRGAGSGGRGGVGADPGAPPGGYGRVLHGRLGGAPARRSVYGRIRGTRCGRSCTGARTAHGGALGAHSGAGVAHSDAVVAVSSPARWYYRGTAPMRRLHWVVTRPSGRLVGRYGFRTRIATEDWDPRPALPGRRGPAHRPGPAAARARRPGPVLPAGPPAHAGRGGGGGRRRAVAGAGDGARGEHDGPVAPCCGPDSQLGGWGGRCPRDPSWRAERAHRAPTNRPKEWRHGSGDDPLLGRGQGRRGHRGGAVRGGDPRRGARRRTRTAPRRAEPGAPAVLVLLIDGNPVGPRGHETVRLAEGGTVEVLPPFAGG
ncbi:hypothetical protein SCYAM73S_03076 [Streptomyces cyaneofuscatus]